MPSASNMPAAVPSAPGLNGVVNGNSSNYTNGTTATSTSTTSATNSETENNIKQNGERLAGKTCIITGGSTGCGRAIAFEFSRQGANVAVLDKKMAQSPKHMDKDDYSGIDTAEGIRRSGGRAIFVQCDVTSREDVVKAIATAVEEFGQINVFVNNAGWGGRSLPLHELTDEDFDKCLSLNSRAAWVCTQEAVKIFLAQKRPASIIHMVSTAGLGGHPRQCAYNMSKAAQAQLVRCAAIEYGPNQIRVNGICPSYMKSAMTAGIWADEAKRDWFSNSIPLRRWGEVNDVVGLSVFLASDESSFMTGDLIRVDGGETLSRYQ